MLHTKGQHMYIAGEVDVLTGEEIRSGIIVVSSCGMAGALVYILL